MTAEKYVKTIVKKVKTSSKRKKEIKQQLLSDINSAVNSGATLEEVIQDLGTIEDMAQGFNESITDAEKKRYKAEKIAIILGIIAICLILLCAFIRWLLPQTSPIETSSTFDQATVEGVAKNVIDLMDADDYEGFRAISNDTMQKFCTDESLKSVKENINSNWGARGSIGNYYLAEIKQQGQKFAYCQVTVTYENTTATYTLTFDRYMRLAGFYIK